MMRKASVVASCILFSFVLLVLFGNQVLAVLHPANKNPGFEPSTPGKNDRGFSWTFRERVNRPNRVDTRGIGFPKSNSLALQGEGRATLGLKAGALFPARARLGLRDIKLSKGRQYDVSLFIRVDEGTRSVPGRFVIVSTFCENGPDASGGFIGVDTIIRQYKGISGQTAENSYREVGYTIIGDDREWMCWVGVLGQPGNPNPVSISVDQFKIDNVGSRSIQTSTSTNLLTDGGFQGPLTRVGYGAGPAFKIQLHGNGWNSDYDSSVSNAPQLIGPSSNRKLRLTIDSPNQRQPFEFSGVVQKVTLNAGQRYSLCVNYDLITPSTAPSSVNFLLFNYYVRLDQGIDFNQDALLRQSEGQLLGKVDVKIYPGQESGSAPVTFIAPVSSSNYQVVLKLNAYGSEGVTNSAYIVEFDNASLIATNSPSSPGC